MTKKEAIELARSAVSEARKGRKPLRKIRESLEPVDRKRWEKEFAPGYKVKPDLKHPKVSKRGSQWLVTFNFIFPRGFFMLPASFVVLVDDVTGQATIPPYF